MGWDLRLGQHTWGPCEQWEVKQLRRVCTQETKHLPGRWASKGTLPKAPSASQAEQLGQHILCEPVARVPGADPPHTGGSPVGRPWHLVQVEVCCTVSVDGVHAGLISGGGWE